MKQIFVYAFDQDERFRFNFNVSIEDDPQSDLFQNDAAEKRKVMAEAKRIIEDIGKNFKRNSHGAHFKRIKTLRYDGKEIRL
jgi:hypothetical protein